MAFKKLLEKLFFENNELHFMGVEDGFLLKDAIFPESLIKGKNIFVRLLCMVQMKPWMVKLLKDLSA